MTDIPRINVKFNGKVSTKVDAKTSADNTVQNFKAVFCEKQECNLPEKINLNLFTTRSEYQDYLEKQGIKPVKQAKHFTLTKSENGFDIYSHTDREKPEYFDLSIKRGVVHSLIENNDKWGKALPTSFKVGMVDYIAGLNEDREVQNSTDDKRDLKKIKENSLGLEEILARKSKYVGLAEQAVKFLESKHGKDFDQLLYKINTETVKEGKNSVNQFIKDTQNHDIEFAYWVADQYHDLI